LTKELSADGGSIACFFEQVQRQITQGCCDFGSVFGADSGAVFGEDIILHPVQAIFDMPVPSKQAQKLLCTGLRRVGW
jgi:hypothetical protein